MRRAITQRNVQDGWMVSTDGDGRDDKRTRVCLSTRARQSSKQTRIKTTTNLLAFSALRRGDLLDGFPGNGAIIRALLRRRDGFLERLFELLRARGVDLFDNLLHALCRRFNLLERLLAHLTRSARRRDRLLRRFDERLVFGGDFNFFHVSVTLRRAQLFDVVPRHGAVLDALLGNLERLCEAVRDITARADNNLRASLRLLRVRAQ